MYGPELDAEKQTGKEKQRQQQSKSNGIMLERPT